MTKFDLEPIVKTYYDALDEGTILGRRCTKCGHIEFPPYLCCNECGCLDTEWVDLTNMRGVVKQALPTRGAFGDPDFRKTHGDYFAVEVEIKGEKIDPFNASLLNIDYDRYEEFDRYIDEHEAEVKPLLFQDEDGKVVAWELTDKDCGFWKEPVIEEPVKTEEEKPQAAAKEESAKQPAEKQAAASYDISKDEIAKTVIDCAAEAYGVDASEITPATDIREDLSNESMKMIVMISEIEDQLDATIEIQEASNLNTIADFINRVKELKGIAPADFGASAEGDAAAADAEKAEDAAIDETAQKVIECAAEAYGVDASEISMSTDIREDLSNESMKMIVMISEIEDQLDVTIEIQEASNLNTIADFVKVVKERM